MPAIATMRGYGKIREVFGPLAPLRREKETDAPLYYSLGVILWSDLHRMSRGHHCEGFATLAPLSLRFTFFEPVSIKPERFCHNAVCCCHFKYIDTRI